MTDAQLFMLIGSIYLAVAMRDSRNALIVMWALCTGLSLFMVFAP